MILQKKFAAGGQFCILKKQQIMKLTYKIIFVIIPFVLISCIGVNVVRKSDSQERDSLEEDKKEKSSEIYIKKVAELLEVPEKKIYYVSTSSEEGFLHRLHPAMISFVKGKKTTSNEDIKVMGSDGLLSSCEVNAINKELIEQHLKETGKDYGAMVLKNIAEREIYRFDPNQITAVMFYADQMGLFAKPYLESLKRLEGKDNIPYIIISMDGKLLTDLQDVYLNKEEAGTLN